MMAYLPFVAVFYSAGMGRENFVYQSLPAQNYMLRQHKYFRLSCQPVNDYESLLNGGSCFLQIDNPRIFDKQNFFITRNNVEVKNFLL